MLFYLHISNYSSILFPHEYDIYLPIPCAESLLQTELDTLKKEIVNESDSRFSLFRFSKIRSATNNFSDKNKLGEGGFGIVYKVIAFS